MSKVFIVYNQNTRKSLILSSPVYLQDFATMQVAFRSQTVGVNPSEIFSEEPESESVMVFKPERTESESESATDWSDSAALVTTTTPPIALFEFENLKRWSRQCLNSVNSLYHAVCSRFFICFLFIIVVLLASINYVNYRCYSSKPVVCLSNECIRSAAAFKQYMDLSVDPCDDFYSYVCGHWADHHPHPKHSKIHSWQDVRQSKIDRIIQEHLATNVSQSDPKPVAQAKAMYRACLRSLEEGRDFEVVQKYLEEFELPTVPALLSQTRGNQQDYTFDWISSVAKIQRKLGYNVLIGLDFVVDERNRDSFRLTLGYPSPSLWGRFPWYMTPALQPEGRLPRITSKEQQQLYWRDPRHQLSWLVRMISPSTDTILDSWQFPTEDLSSFINQLPKEDNEWQVEKPAYYTVTELQNLTDSQIAPGNPYPVWQHYLNVLYADLPDIKLAADETLQIEPKDVKYLSNLIGFLSKQSPELIELYVWQKATQFLLRHPSNRLSSIEDCAEGVHKLMGLAVIYAIADKNFITETKPRVQQMFNDIRSEFKQMVLEKDWLDDHTKHATIEKSKAMESQIGFPEWILNVDKLEEYYRGLQVDQIHHFENWVDALQLLIRTNLQFLHVNVRNVSKGDSKAVNAFNNLYWNVINIPMGTVQFPYYYLGLEALNYGALGYTLGHELTHGFDDYGRYHDKVGRFRQVWSDHSIQEFNDRASCLVEQYDNYYVPEAKGYIKGKLTLRENIADNGGIREAFRAYRSYIKRNGPEPLLPGFENFTHEQLFFISFGNTRCATLSSDDAEQILRDKYSPPRFRVLGALSNMEEFNEAFQCPRGSKMNPEKKCRVW